MADAFEKLRQAVERNGDLTQSIVVLIKQLTDEVGRANDDGDGDAIAELVEKLNAQADALAAAVTANTYAAPTALAPTATSSAPSSQAEGTTANAAPGTYAAEAVPGTQSEGTQADPPEGKAPPPDDSKSR